MIRKAGRRSVAGCAVLAFVAGCLVFAVVRALDPWGGDDRFDAHPEPFGWSR